MHLSLQQCGEAQIKALANTSLISKYPAPKGLGYSSSAIVPA
jgi:hypothetical protein